ncbi:MAG: hypothetical protein OQK82_09210, partial [Candidatus Pacearchaeota archaeon]|nr:hypothetical protein [Candidatus Pacearchaeota archaeon]
MHRIVFGLIVVSGLSFMSFAGDGHKCGLHKTGDKAEVSCKHEKKCSADLEACKKKCDSDVKCIEKCEQECKKQCKMKKEKTAGKAVGTERSEMTLKPQTTCPVMGGAIDK